jgi:proteasome lid subunit RPN8/RPN11
MTSASTSSESSLKTENKLSGSLDDHREAARENVGVAGKLPSSLIEGSLLHGSEPDQVNVSVVVNQSALQQLDSHCNSVLDSEIGGVLLGTVERREDKSIVLVEAALPVQTDDYGPVHFTFTADSWASLHKERAQLHPEMDIVGWYHTHPGLGVFYSSDDVVVHSAAFVLPWHVGLVIDPVHREGSFFAWQTAPSEAGEPGLAPLPGYYEFLDEQEDSLSSWEVVGASVWPSGSYLPATPAVSDQVYVPANEWPSLPPISPWWGVLLGGASLLLTLLILLDRLLAWVR